MNNHERGFCDIYLSRPVTEIMRGVSIVFIMLHNLCHLYIGCVDENEFGFNKANLDLFFERATALSPAFAYDFFSFMGWYGVPVFIFLSGYGLVCKYEQPGGDRLFTSRGVFIYRNWVKLVMLVLPAVLWLVGSCVYSWIITGNRTLYYIARNIFTLTFLNDAFNPWLSASPGVYWYFGLALELYIFYALGVWRRSRKIIVVAVVISVILQIAALPSSLNSESDVWIEWVRHNITGWCLVFTFGIYYARHRRQKLSVIVSVSILALLLFVPCQLDAIAWQVTPLCAVVIVILTSIILAKIRYVGMAFVWIGKLSPFVFVTHPLVRSVIIDKYGYEIPTLPVILEYVAVTFIVAVVYRIVWRLFNRIPLERLGLLLIKRNSGKNVGKGDGSQG